MTTIPPVTEVVQSTAGDRACAQRPVSHEKNRTELGLPRLYTAKEIAEALRATENWVKERARRRQIPFTLVGGSYRFSEEHLEQIIEIFEQLPQSKAGQVATAPRRRAQSRKETETASAVVPLQPRQPRRRPKAG